VPLMQKDTEDLVGAGQADERSAFFFAKASGYFSGIVGNQDPLRPRSESATFF